MPIARALEILKHQFGYDDFRMNQQAALECVLAKKDCLVLMPTGGGKSLCYQIPALMQDGLTVVVSPLIALMKDQVDALRLNGVKAAFLNSSQDSSAQQEVMAAIRDGEIRILYVAPERLLQGSGQFIDFLKSLRVSLFAIDEAHCISSWGHDFRPEYTQLGPSKNCILSMQRYFLRVSTVPIFSIGLNPSAIPIPSYSIIWINAEMKVELFIA